MWQRSEILRSMAARAVSQLRFAKRPHFPCRPPSRFSSTSGRVLTEEERAAENMYIKKMEKEKLEKISSKGVKTETTTESAATGFDSQTIVKDISSDSNKNVAVAAGVVSIVAAGLWYYRVNQNVQVEDDKE